MAEDAPTEQPPQKIRRMPESYGCRRGAGRVGRGRGEGVTRRLPSRLMVFLDGLSNPGFQQMISDILLDGDGGYRPDMQFYGSQVHVDLNDGPLHVFMALGGILHRQHTCQVDPGRYRSWSLPVC
ncbi:hypothetical protein PIB30_034161 [Stylosanthes scabra]|uniref:Uncharacterized protein n=1 Tax=Stylosanthes scabra TaxID=79078 RepID=A0ABU6XEH7_9FABA|nr:hypothetical protein [Stylosanthes scabra]